MSNRLLLDWIAASRSADEEIKGDIRRLRARARELARNNSYIKRYFRLLRNNVIGSQGITLQALVTRPSQGEEGETFVLDTAVNDEIERAWRTWARKPVTLDGKLSLRRFEQLILKTVACDGETFVRLWRGVEGNPFGLALQAIDADLIDERLNRPARDGQNEIRMGVEVDELSRPVGFWCWTKPSSVSMTVIRERYFVPASEMIHLYDPDRVNQTRGVTWVHSIMVPAHMLDAYEESEAVAARVAAAKMGFLQKRADSLGPDLAGEKDPAMIEANPGSIEIVPEGYEFNGWSPDHPTGQFGAFVEQMARKVATGLGVFYNVLANDARGVSYSSMRSFALVERDDWRGIQNDFIEMWRVPLYDVWLSMALLTRKLRLPSQNPDRYREVEHRPRGWAWIDPEKAAKGAVLSIENGLGTRAEVLAERGLDVEDVFRQLRRELDLAEKWGIKIDGGAPKEEPVTASEVETQIEAAAEEAAGGGNGDGRDHVMTSNDVTRRLVSVSPQPTR